LRDSVGISADCRAPNFPIISLVPLWDGNTAKISKNHSKIIIVLDKRNLL